MDNLFLLFLMRGGQQHVGANLLGMIQCQKQNFHPSSWFLMH